MNTLAMDTCEQRGSVSVRVAGECRATRIHEEGEYSSWLLPAVDSCLTEAGLYFAQVDLLAVATGPGSFTGVRVGLCAAKAWSEVYDLKIAGVSRLAALASSAKFDGWVAACYDAHRGQLFAALYRKVSGRVTLLDHEMVISPSEFLANVRGRTRGEEVQWLSLDPQILSDLPDWSAKGAGQSAPVRCSPVLAGRIGQMGEEKARRNELTGVLELEANYVRRSDAEIYWKGPDRRAAK